MSIKIVNKFNPFEFIASQKYKRQRQVAFIAVSAITIVFVGSLFAQALISHITFEAENGILSTNVTIVSDMTATKNQAISFAGAQTSSTGRCQHTSSRICYNGSLHFINGVNTPWIEWNGDFGGGGVVRNRTELLSRFGSFNSTGSSVVRWWVLEGGAWQINRDSTGKPTSLNNAIYTDLDAALEIAQQRDLYFNFMLFGGMSNDAIPSSWRTNTTHRQALADVLAPLFARYKDNPRVMSWEIWNEPEWQYWNGVDGATREQAVDIANRIITVIRREAPKAMTTVGQATVGALRDWKDVDLDFDSPHWYDPMTDAASCAICTTANALRSLHGTSRPIVIGEYFQSPGTNTQNLARMNDLYTRGYAGLWAWSLFHERTADRMQVDLTAMTSFSGQHTDIGP